ncbi:MAG: PqqD family protein [Elusimicrobiales bacterium]
MRISPRIIWRQIDGEVFVIDPLNEKIYEMNETASFVFKMIKKGLDIERIVKKMIDCYDVKEDKCRDDVLEIIEYLLRNEVIDEE